MLLRQPGPKRMKFMQQKDEAASEHYVVPEVTVYDVEVEKGFGASDDEIPPMIEDPWEDL